MKEHIFEYDDMFTEPLGLPHFPKEEIVRCRDCKDYRESDATCHSWQWHNWDAAIEVEPDGFCAWGERRGA